MSDEWYYANNNRRSGPVTRAEIDRLIDRGTIMANTLVWGEGMADWARAGDVLRLPQTVAGKARAATSGPVALPEPGFKKAAEKALPTQRAEPKPETVSPWGGSKNASPWGGLSKGGSRQWDGNSFGGSGFEETAPTMAEAAPSMAPARAKPRPAPTGIPRNITGPANIITAALHALRNAANFQGRDVRWQFWYSVLVVVIIGTAVNNADLGGPIFIGDFLVSPSQLVWLAAALPLVASLVRRLHDGGYSGMFAWLLLVPGIGTLILAGLAAMPTQAGDNQYGPEPRNG